MIEEIRELLNEIHTHKINASTILNKLVTLYKINDLEIPDIVKNEREGYQGVSAEEIPSYRKIPYSAITVNYSTGFEKGTNIPLNQIFVDESGSISMSVEKWLNKINYALRSPLVDFDNWIESGGVSLKVDTEVNEMMRALTNEGGGSFTNRYTIQNYLLRLTKEHLETIVSKVRFQLKDEIILLAKTHNVSSKLSMEFNKDIISLIRDKRILGSLTEAWKCYSAECYTAGSIMLRKSLETSIHIGFRSKFGDDDLLKDNDAKYHGLKKKMDIVVGKGLAGSSIVDTLKVTTKLLSDLAAHSFTVKLREDDFKNANNVLRTFMEDFFTRLSSGQP